MSLLAIFTAARGWKHLTKEKKKKKITLKTLKYNHFPEYDNVLRNTLTLDKKSEKNNSQTIFHISLCIYCLKRSWIDGGNYAHCAKDRL